MSVVKQGQSFLDKVTQQTGSFENVLEMALLNDVSITDKPAIGDEFKPVPVSNKLVKSFFNQYNEPATALTAKETEAIDNVGIGSMIIENNFEVA